MSLHDMNLHKDDRLALFIDGANLHASVRQMGIDVDYRKLRALFASRSRLLRAFYYTALLDEIEHSPMRPLIDWLEYNGFTLVTKPAKEFTDPDGQRKIKGNMDIEMAVDMLNLADRLDHAVLFSGDGDFRSLVEAVQQRGVRVTVISTIRTFPPMAADELRRQADAFIDLADLVPDIARQRNGVVQPPDSGLSDG